MFAGYLKNQPKLKPALIAAGIPEDVAEIAATDALNRDKMRSTEHIVASVLTWFGFWFAFLFFPFAYNVASYLGGWPAMAGVGLFIVMTILGIHYLMARHLKWFRSYRFTSIALGRSVMLGGSRNVAALRRAEGKSGQDFINAVLDDTFFNLPVAIFGTIFALFFFMMSAPGRALLPG